MPSTGRALVVGATGHLGAKIVGELLARGASVRITRRSGSKADTVEALRARGAEVVAADLTDAASLARACAGIDVVVSALQGGRDVIVDGQTRILRAAESTGVARFFPSDYSLDFFKTAPGNRNLDLRRELNGVLDGAALRGTSVLCGAFMDLLRAGRIGPDPQTGIYKVWGSPDQLYDFTLTDDVARYIAAAALDPDAPRILRVAGDTLSPRQLGDRFAAARGIPTVIEPAGSLEDLGRTIDRLRAADPDPTSVFPVWQQLMYARDMASGRGQLIPLDNGRYPDIHPFTVAALLANH